MSNSLSFVEGFYMILRFGRRNSIFRYTKVFRTIENIEWLRYSAEYIYHLFRYRRCIMEDRIVLILNGNRIEVNKCLLAQKSRYFGSLFSYNFNDSQNKDHAINYDIELSTLQDFVCWVENESYQDVYCHDIKVSMVKFTKDSLAELLNLLQLSVLFMVDELTDDITEILVLCYLSPDKVIDVWLLAKELNIRALQDVCLSICLDRFEELPVSMLVELSKDDIGQLIENVNVRSSIEYLQLVRNKWMTRHTVSETANIVEKRIPKSMQGTVVLEKNKDGLRVGGLYTWDGRVFSKCAQLKSTQDAGKSLIGMQAVGRGFSIYTVGGEMGLGTGQFNHIIWRYCLLSKKWYYQARLPVPRRHMVVAFLKNKLLIVGGVGRHRLKLFTMDILDIHTGTWKKGAKVPESFTDVPPHCIFEGKLFVLKTSLYIYDADENYWETVLVYNNTCVQTVDALVTYGAALFVIGNHSNETVLSRIDVTADANSVKGNELEVEYCNTTVANIVHEEDLWELRYMHVAGYGVLIVSERPIGEYEHYLHFHSEIRRDFENAVIPKMTCFEFTDPATLYDTV